LITPNGAFAVQMFHNVNVMGVTWVACLSRVDGKFAAVAAGARQFERTARARGDLDRP